MMLSDFIRRKSHKLKSPRSIGEYIIGQYTGLNDSQGRTENKLNFHFNASIATINIAKVEHWLSQPKEERKPF